MRRRRGLALAATLLVAACTSDADLPLGSADPTTTVTRDDGTRAPDPGDQSGSETTQGTTPPGDDGTSPNPTPRPADTQPGEPDPPVVDDAPPATGSVGAYAPFYLRPGASAAIVIEVRSQAGAEPASSTLDHVRNSLAEVSRKDVLLAGGTIDGGARDWTAADLRALADTGAAQTRDRAVLRLYFLRGSFDGDDGVLGIAVRSDMTAIFSDQVSSAAGLVGDRARIERAVALHEVGHVLGLVDLFLDTGREDPEHPGHSSSQQSVMYWAVESSLVGQVLSGGPPTTFDDADRNDLATIRNG